MIREEIQKLNEANPSAYIDAHNKMYKAYETFAREVMNLSDFVDKETGDKTDSKIIKNNFKKQVIPFIALMKSWLRGKVK